jgi:hypothetical protein
MLGLHELFTKAIEGHLAPERVLTRIISKWLKDINIELTAKQSEALQAQVLNLADGTLSFEFEDEQLVAAGLASDQLNVALKDALKDLGGDIEKYAQDVPSISPDVLLDMVHDIAVVLRRSLKDRAQSMLDERANDIRNFTAALKEQWGRAIDLLDTQIVIAAEVNAYLHQKQPKTDRVLDVLIRLQARACQIASEIVVLLRNGYADGAHARWRSLHEIAVVGYFIAKHGEEFAQRYLSHHIVESYKGSLHYQKYADELGLEKFTEEETKDFKDRYDEIVRKYGPDYKNQYGWAAAALNKSNPTFSDIEAAISLDHLRPYYKLASHNVHAGPKGFFKLGLYPWEQAELLTGPSNTGLVDPGQSTAISLNQITTNLLNREESLDSLVITRVMMMVGDEVCQAFVETGAREEETSQ